MTAFASDNPSAPRRGAGRPRHSGRSGSTAPREEILDAVARLFVTQGVAATSTREIADAVGIRQSSLYYHFPSGKDEILGDLLERTVRPTVEKINQLEQLSVCPATMLYLLVILDIRTLGATQHNTAFLARLPEVTRSEAYAGYASIRQELAEGYERFGRKVEALSPGFAPSPLNLGHQLLQMVEVVITFRKNGTPVDAAAIAASCLRICGATTEQITSAATSASDVLEDLDGS